MTSRQHYLSFCWGIFRVLFSRISQRQVKIIYLLFHRVITLVVVKANGSDMWTAIFYRWASLIFWQAVVNGRTGLSESIYIKSSAISLVLQLPSLFVLMARSAGMAIKFKCVSGPERLSSVFQACRRFFFSIWKGQFPPFSLFSPDKSRISILFLAFKQIISHISFFLYQ